MYLVAMLKKRKKKRANPTVKMSSTNSRILALGSCSTELICCSAPLLNDTLENLELFRELASASGLSSDDDSS